MARVSTKENKNIYQITREGLKLSREAASELLESIPPERIEKIENERSLPHPDEVLVMSDKYMQPSLCNYYCANQCPIGQEYVPEIKVKDLSQIVLELQKLQEQIARKRQLEAQVSELRTQRSTLSTRVRELEAIKMQEQADVDKLEGRSLAAFFYNVIGKMDEQLNKEREEAYAARVKYDAAARELTAVEDELARYEAELSSLRDCERQYDAVLQEKAGAVKAAGGPAAEEILKLEERLAFLESQKRELREAVSAGNSALSTANHVLSSLDSAEGWGTWDLFGGGLISDLAKHSHLDEAQGNIEHLQSQLRRFKTELADVRISADMQVNVDGFLRFADYFFDGLFADWAVLDRINQSQEQVHSTKRQIENVLSRLNGMQRSVEQEQNQLESKLDTLVRDAKI